MFFGTSQKAKESTVLLGVWTTNGALELLQSSYRKFCKVPIHRMLHKIPLSLKRFYKAPVQRRLCKVYAEEVLWTIIWRGFCKVYIEGALQSCYIEGAFWIPFIDGCKSIKGIFKAPIEGALESLYTEGVVRPLCRRGFIQHLGLCKALT